MVSLTVMMKYDIAHPGPYEKQFYTDLTESARAISLIFCSHYTGTTQRETPGVHAVDAKVRHLRKPMHVRDRALELASEIVYCACANPKEWVMRPGAMRVKSSSD